MSSKSLKGLTIKFGGDTSDLYESLNKVEKKGRSLSGELGQINKALKLDPGNTELIAQKQKVLAEAAANAEAKLNTLREAEKQVQEQFERGEASQEQVRALRREIIETTSKINRYKKAAEELADSEEEVADGADKAAKKVDEQAEKTRKAEKATEDMDDAAGDLAAGGLAAMTAGAAACLAAIVAMNEESREYRTEMSKLDTAFKSSNHQASTATKTYKTLQSVIGETDQAVEAAQQIALLADSEKDAAEWANLAAGVIGRLGNALQPEVFYESANETLKLNAATGGYVQLLEQCGANVEEFNLGLEACSTEQEKQEYMLNVTKQLLGAAADQYRQTNAEIIRSNEATEKWNEATARIGGAVEPAVTDLRELGAVLLGEVNEPLEDAAGYVRNDVIPAIRNLSTGIKSNMPLIKASVVGVTAAFAALKVATIANTVAQTGFAASLKATAIAQKALNLAKAATPWGLVAVAVAGVTAAVIAYIAATKKAKTPVSALTEEEKALAKAADEAAEAFRDQQESTKKALGNVSSEMDHIKDLTDELQYLADASGRVQEKDQARAQFILGEMKRALGEEYEMVDGVILQYDKLTKSIDQVMQSKTASALLEAANADYIASLQGKAQASENMGIKEKEYDALDAEYQSLARTQSQYEQQAAVALENLDFVNAAILKYKADQMDDEVETARAAAETARLAYEDAASVYYDQLASISNYETAQEAALAGNYQTTIDMLTRKSEAYAEFSGVVDEESRRILQTLWDEATMAGVYAEETRRHFAEGVEGITQETVDEAEAAAAAALEEFENAYADFMLAGENLVDGMNVGINNKRAALIGEAKSLVNDFLAAARRAADSHSPSRKSMKVFEDIGEGGVIGLKNKTDDIKQAGTDQAAAVLSAYREQEVNAQRTLLGIADQQAARQTAGQMSAASANGPMLEQILTAIKEGQILVIDGDTVVGATAGRMDSALGQRRILASRGAIK